MTGRNGHRLGFFFNHRGRFPFRFEGVLPQDRTWAKHLRGKPHVLLVVNKVDNYRRAATVPDFFSLGLGAPFAVSAANGRGSGDLLDAIVDRLADLPPKKVTANQTMEPLTLAILGQPNSGKSTLMNAILGEHRMITSAVPHTTREPIDVLFTYRGQPLLLIDTAGIRRKAHVTRGVEASGVKASLQTVDRADVILLVIDLMRGVSRQDQRLASYMAEHRKGLVIVANKWDLVADKKPETMQALEHGLRRALPGCNWAPIVFTSALTQHRVPQTIEAALGAHTSGALSLSEGTLQQFLKTVTKHHLPMKGGGVRHPKILSFKQVAANPPQFEIVVRGELHPAYVKFLEHRLRQHFGFTGAPITITLKTKRRRIIK